MAEREQIRRTHRDKEAETTGSSTEAAASKQGEKVKAETDAFLDEIDEVLETNAEEFVKSYVQKGGQ
jgi:prokaryotic ubiquitin-like protein Pup